MSTEQDAAKFWAEVEQLEKSSQSADPVYEYRIYYEEDGTVISGQPVRLDVEDCNPLPTGSYITVSFEEYQNLGSKIVKDGALYQPPRANHVQALLEKADSGQNVVKNNAALAINENETYQDVEQYGRKSD